jgi:hypothetical protein
MSFVPNMNKCVGPASWDKKDTTTSWHRAFVHKVQELIHCSHDEAFAVLGIVIDLRESSSQQGFQRGYDSANLKGKE